MENNDIKLSFKILDSICWFLIEGFSSSQNCIAISVVYFKCTGLEESG